MALLDDSLKGRLLFAIPKKGRLYEKCLELLKGADIQFTRSARLDVALVRNLPIALVFLPAADIPRFVGEGNIDMGITGQDMVAESGVDTSLIQEALQLSFGKCKLQVQVPEKSPFEKAEDLLGKKIATSFEVVSSRFFQSLEQQQQTKKTTIEYVSGSVETACALGLADGIVDLVESGDTMRAAGLKSIHTILSSQAVLIQSMKPTDREHLPVMQLIISRIAGVLAAQKYVLCLYNVQRSLLAQACAITPGRRAPTVTDLNKGQCETYDDWVAVNAMVEESQAATVMDQLQAIGAQDVFILQLRNCRV